MKGILRRIANYGRPYEFTDVLPENTNWKGRAVWHGFFWAIYVLYTGPEVSEPRVIAQGWTFLKSTAIGQARIWAEMAAEKPDEFVPGVAS